MIVCPPIEHEMEMPPIGATGADEARFLGGLVLGMRCGILAVDVNGRIRFVNGLACRILGMATPPPAGAPAATVLAEHPRLVQVLGEAYTLSHLPNRAELPLGRDGGRTIGFTMSLVLGDGCETAGAAIFFKDLTQIEHREERERLKDRLAALGQMAAGLAHEIRNPLASIEVSCSLLKRRLSDAEARELLDKIVAEVRRLNSTVDGSLEYVRPLALRLAPVPLEPLIEEAIAVADARCGTPQIAVRRSFTSGMPPFLMDRDLLRQVFENLLLNAMEALGGRGTISVSTEVIDSSSETSVPYGPSAAGTADSWPRAEQFVVVRIADDGPGIAECDLDRIFHPMFTTKKRGSGIGLAVVRKIVSSHHGLIDVQCTPERGTEFSVRLPMALSAPEVRNR